MANLELRISKDLCWKILAEERRTKCMPQGDLMDIQWPRTFKLSVEIVPAYMCSLGTEQGSMHKVMITQPS